MRSGYLLWKRSTHGSSRLSTRIKVVALSTLGVDDHIREHFAITRPEVFSGALVPYGNGAVVVENDSHPAVRRRSTMGHELAHVFGEHRFGASLVNERGCRLADQAQENKAAEIAGELLVPFEAAKLLARREATNEEVALQFGVSVDLARWRMDATGAWLIARRRAQTTTARRAHKPPSRHSPRLAVAQPAETCRVTKSPRPRT